MPLTTQSFSNKKKSNAHFMVVSIPNNLHDTISAISNKYKSDISNTTRTLLYIALKNNFTTELQYIPCEKISSIPFPMLNRNKNKNQAVTIRTSPNLLKKLTTLQKHYHHRFLSETVRSLIHIAIQHNYNNKLEFIPATPIKNNTQQITSNNNGIIVIDKL